MSREFRPPHTKRERQRVKDVQETIRALGGISLYMEDDAADTPEQRATSLRFDQPEAWSVGYTERDVRRITPQQYERLNAPDDRL